MAKLLTLSSGNQATFDCPIFGVETKVATCGSLRDKVWAGTLMEKRGGCRACIADNKCPISSIISKIIYSKEDPENLDVYGSREPKKIRLRDDVLGRVLPVMVQESTLRRFNVSDQERMLIETANDRIRSQMVSAPKASEKVANIRRANQPRKVEKQTPMVNPAHLAAATGDISAAINQAT
ncbi:MAG: hypothetical protein ACEQSB_00445 [Undibacterium sp.]